jgi:hypothetical protein
MVGFLKIMAKNEFRLQRGTGDQGGKTQYRHTVSIHPYHKSICIGNGMAVASTQYHHGFKHAFACFVRKLGTLVVAFAQYAFQSTQ